jgi:hypothetical protein
MVEREKHSKDAGYACPRADLKETNRMAKASWLPRTAAILASLEEAAPLLDRRTIEEVFELQRRAALRLMERFDPVGAGEGGEWRIRRDALLTWLRQVHREQEFEDARAQRVRTVLGEREEQDRRLRAELRRAGRPEPAAWAVPPAAFAATMRGLPEGVRILPGRIEVDFPAADPVVGMQRMHALGLAILNDCEGFQRMAGLPADGSAASLAQLEASLEATKQAGVDGL